MIKYVVKAKGEEESLAQLVGTALQESEIKSQRFKGNQGSSNWSGPGYSEVGRRDHRPQIKRGEYDLKQVLCVLTYRPHCKVLQ
jgi:hypothetical protein